MSDFDNDSPDGPSERNLGLAQEMRDALRVAVHMVRVLEYPGDLSTAQVSVLNTLTDGPARVGDLARLGGVTQPGMSQLVSRLENAGLVRRTGSATDARVTLVEMTEEGRDTLGRVNRERNRVLALHLDRLSATDQDRVRKGLGPMTRLAADVVGQDLLAGPPTGQDTPDTTAPRDDNRR